jgi:hypothetical protein
MANVPTHCGSNFNPYKGIGAGSRRNNDANRSISAGRADGHPNPDSNLYAQPYCDFNPYTYPYFDSNEYTHSSRDSNTLTYSHADTYQPTDRDANCDADLANRYADTSSDSNADVDGRSDLR